MSTIVSTTDGRSTEAVAFDHFPVPALVIDRQGVIVVANTSAKVLLYIDNERAEHSPLLLSELIGADNDQLSLDIFMGVSVGFISLLLKNVGDEPGKRFRFSITPLKTQPRQINQFLLTQSLESPASKNFIQLNSAVRNANMAAAKEHRMLQKLESAYQRVSEFSAMAAHDLQAPLRNIDGFLSILEEDHGDELSGDGLVMLKQTRKSAKRLQELIVGLLHHAKARTSSVMRESINLQQAINLVHDDLSVTIDQCEGKVELSGNMDVLEADKLLFGQLLSNLIGNAIKYRSPDRAPYVQVVCLRSSATAFEINIQDNGLGFDNEQRTKILQPFKRLLTQSVVEGSGLGLATCKSICDLHGWTLSCVGQPGVGAKFSIQSK